MTIIVRCILHKPVTPPCYILCLDHDEWRTFLFATPQERMRMVLTKLKRTYLLGATREMVWIPYESQNKIITKENKKTTKMDIPCIEYYSKGIELSEA